MRLPRQESMLLRKRQHHSNAENLIRFYLFRNDIKNGDLLTKDYLRHLVKVLITQLCLTLRPHGLLPARLLCPWNSPGKNIVLCHFLL